MIGLRQPAHAETSVNVDNTTSTGSNTHVVVNSNVNSLSNTTSVVNSNTRVHIETNGEVKDFTATGDESIDWQSEDGKSSVKINTSAKTTPKPESGISSVTPSSTPSAQEEAIEDKKSPATHGFSLVDFFKKIFSFLGFSH